MWPIIVSVKNKRKRKRKEGRRRRKKSHFWYWRRITIIMGMRIGIGTGKGGWRKVEIMGWISVQPIICILKNKANISNNNKAITTNKKTNNLWHHPISK